MYVGQSRVDAKDDEHEDSKKCTEHRAAAAAAAANSINIIMLCTRVLHKQSLNEEDEKHRGELAKIIQSSRGRGEGSWSGEIGGNYAKRYSQAATFATGLGLPNRSGVRMLDTSDTLVTLP